MPLHKEFWRGFKEKAHQLLHLIHADAHGGLLGNGPNIGGEIALQAFPCGLIGNAREMGLDLVEDEGIDDASSADHEGVAVGLAEHR